MRHRHAPVPWKNRNSELSRARFTTSFALAQASRRPVGASDLAACFLQRLESSLGWAGRDSAGDSRNINYSPCR